jgi:membrane protein
MEALAQRLQDRLWPAAAPEGRLHQAVLVTARYVYALLRELGNGELSLRAMSLVYTTMLAIVPLLAFSFALLKGLGVHRDLAPLLSQFLDPLGGERATEITDSVVGFVDNISGSVLASVSIGLLLFAALQMAQKVEGSFNFVWRVDRPRNFARRFAEYLSVMLVGPLVMSIAMGLIASLSSVTLVTRMRAIEPIGSWIASLADLVPYLLVIGAFTVLYLLIPNTRVRLKPALIGGAFAGAAWAAGGSLFAALVVNASRTEAIYSGFAIVIFAMIWMYLSWLILLFGAQLAFYVQNPEFLRQGHGTTALSSELREHLALSVMLLVGRDFAAPAYGWRETSLAARIRVPKHYVELLTDVLKEEGLLAETQDQRLIPGRDPRHIPVAEIVMAVRKSSSERAADASQDWNATVAELTNRIDTAIVGAIGGRSLADLVDEDAGEPASVEGSRSITALRQ